MKTIQIKFRGIDNWNRPVFKDVNSKNHFGSVNTLFNSYATEDEIINFFRANLGELEYFGNSFGCEPHGGLADNITFEIIN